MNQAIYNETGRFLEILKNGNRKPQQRAKLPPFLRGKHPVTQAALSLIVGLRWK